MPFFQNLVPKGSAPPARGTSGGLDIGTLVEIRNRLWKAIIPPGRLLTAMLSIDGSLPSIFGAIIKLIQGRRFYEQHYKLGERLIDQVQCSASVGWREVPDEVVPVARLFFTMFFGVRITSGEDLDALDSGVDAYYARGNKEDIPRAAVERAVILKQNFYPISTYNVKPWNIALGEKYPLVAPIPSMNASDTDDRQNVGKLYTGPGFNGQQFVNGLLKYTAPAPTAPGTPVPAGSNGPEVSVIDDLLSFVKTNPMETAIVVGALAFLTFED